MNVIHIGRCEEKACARFDGDHCQLWISSRKRLCWFCWREALGLETNHATIAKQYGEAFAEMVTMARALGGRQRGAA